MIKIWSERSFCRRCFQKLGFTWAIAIATMLGACRQEEPAETHQASQVEVAVAAPIRQLLPRTIRVTGTLYGTEETTIAAKVAGRIIEVIRDLGDSAHPGDPLIVVDPTDYELALAERQRAYSEALARLGVSDQQESDAQFEAIDIDSLPAVDRARLQAENARARFERARVLAERDPPLISEQDFADLRTAYDVAQSNLRVERLTAEAVLAEARTLAAQVQMASQRVFDTVHRAPGTSGQQSAVSDQLSAGRDSSGLEASNNNELASPLMSNSNGELRYEVAARMVTVGDFVQIGTPIMRLVDADPLKLRVQVPERRLGSVKVGQAAHVQVEAFSAVFEGRVARVSPAVDMATRAFAVEILVPNADHTLKPGSFATTEIEVAREAALMVPASAITTFAGVHKVVVVENGKAREQRIELGMRVDGMVEIRTGLAAGDQIVVTPNAAISTGTPVRIVQQSTELQSALAPPDEEFDDGVKQ